MMRNFLFGIFICIDCMLAALIITSLLDIHSMAIYRFSCNSILTGELRLFFSLIIGGLGVAFFLSNASRIYGCITAFVMGMLIAYFVAHLGFSGCHWTFVLRVAVQFFLDISVWSIALLAGLCLRKIAVAGFAKWQNCQPQE